MFRVAAVALLLAAPLAAQSLAPPSIPEVDAPELAKLGAAAVGVRTLTLINKDQPDLLATDPKTGVVPRHDRSLKVDIFYPALASQAARVTYRAAMTAEPPLPPVAFSVPGIAVENAKPAPGRYPLVVLSHGYGNVTAALSWLTENLASKGYVVAAIRHDDPDIADRAKFVGPLVNRPRDITFAAASLQKQLPDLIDPTRTALIGYSMGGYGVLTVAGAAIDPGGMLAKGVPGGELVTLAKNPAALQVAGLKAVVAISPFGGNGLDIWGSDGLAGVSVPLLFIAGNRDKVVGYDKGAAGFFATTPRADRYLLTFREAGHSIGLNPAPPEMTSTLWDFDWFEDAVWRKRRINAINQHFITAFLARTLKADAAMGAYLDVPVVNSDDGVWPVTPGSPDAVPRYAGHSPGTGSVTVWKGFLKGHATGLELRHAAAGQTLTRSAE